MLIKTWGCISLRPTDANMRQSTRLSLVQTTACRGAKPLSEPMLVNCQLDPQEQTSGKFELKYEDFHWRTWKCITKLRLQNGGHFVSASMWYTAKGHRDDVSNESTCCTNPTMHQSHIPQFTTLSQKCAHVCTFLLQNGALWYICMIHCGICEMGLLYSPMWRLIPIKI